MSSQQPVLLRTPLTTWHEAAGARMADFAGWSMPLEYPSGTVTEHKAVRSGCGIFDVSHMGTVIVAGSEAVFLLNTLLTNDLDRLAPGAVQYTLLCNESGGVIDDMLATRLAPDEVMLVPNAANTAAVVDAVRAVVGERAMADASAETAILAVQGPASALVLTAASLPTGHDYMTIAEGEFDGLDVIVSRSGYTGEHGFELIVPVAIAGSLWEEIVNSPQVTPAGLGARDTLRTEMGYPLHGQDLTEHVTPVEAGLGWAVAWEKPQFTGRDALRAQRETGPERRLRGLLVSGRGIPRPDMTVGTDGGQVGTVTSGTFSPSLRTGVALGLLDANVPLDAEVQIDIRGRAVPAIVTKPPFVAASPR